ncbi:hypothetical protein Golomagni_03240, partial [Golovinomyces magnicellulatus]
VTAGAVCPSANTNPKSPFLAKVFSVAFTKAQINNGAKNVCNALALPQGCSGIRLCKLKQKPSKKPEPYEGTLYTTTKIEKFYLSCLIRKGQLGYNDFRGIVRWKRSTGECGNVATIKYTLGGSGKKCEVSSK